MTIMTAFALTASAAASALTVSSTPPEERLVGMAYSTWFPPIRWDHVWGTPELGHYRSDDPMVIKQHAEWLNEAGVDFIWIDWSNNVDHDPGMQDAEPLLRDGQRWLAYRPDIAQLEAATEAVFRTYAELPEHPKISIFIGCPGAKEAVTDGRLQRKADQVYEQFVADPTYGALMQRYLGKPLLAIYVGTPSPFRTGLPDWDDPRFTVRWFTGFVTEQSNLRDGLLSKYGYWSWEDRGPQTYTVHDGQAEAMVVTAATRRQGEPEEILRYVPERGRRDGATFRQAWARAREIGPKFAMVVAWNEWSSGENPSVEVSKDIEPSEEFGDQYLRLLREEIVRFKRPLVPQEPPLALHLAEFGAKGDGKADDGPAFVRAMSALNQVAGPATLNLGERKTYRIATLPGAPGESSGSRRGFVFPFEGADRKVVEGHGSHLILRFPLRLIKIAGSEGLTVRGLSFTYDPLPFTQGRIEAVDPDAHTLDVQVDPGFPLPTFDAPEVEDQSRAWHFCWTFQPSCHVWTRTIKAIDPAHSAKGVFRVFAKENVPVGLLMNGSRQIVVPTLGTVDGVPQCSSGTHSTISGSQDILIEDIHQHVAPHFSFAITYNTGKIELRNVDIRPPDDSGRQLASWRDGFHIKTNRGPIVVEDCDLAWLRDDCINISAIALTVEQQLGPKVYQFRVRNREGFPSIQPGFTIEGWNKATGKHCGAARVVSVRSGTGKGYWNTILMLDRELANVVADGETTSFWCHEYVNAGAIIRNNRFDGSARFRAPGLYEGNLITGFMIVKPDVNECPLTRDMIFRGNQLPGAGIPTVFCVYRDEGPVKLPPWNPADPPDQLVQRIVFENNALGRPIHLFDATDITFRGNTRLPSLEGSKALILRNTGAVSTDLSAEDIERLVETAAGPDSPAP